MTLAVTDLESAGQVEFLALMREVYGSAMSEREFDWYFERNPAGRGIVSVAESNGHVVGVSAMALARALVGGREMTVAFAVHAATHPTARGKGAFSRLELRNEERAAAEGASLALGFTNPLAGPILVGRLGWRDLYRMRIWARPLRPLRALRRRGGGGLPAGHGGTLTAFTAAHERAWRAVQDGWGDCLVRDTAYLNWRYLQSPKDYRAFASENGYAVVGHAVHAGVSAAAVCDLVGPPREQRRLLRRCVEAARGGADAVVAVPGPGQRAAYLSQGFVPTPRTIRVIGKPLVPEAPLPAAWHFALGDTDLV